MKTAVTREMVERFSEIRLRNLTKSFCDVQLQKGNITKSSNCTF